jgi:hypothetical protein
MASMIEIITQAESDLRDAETASAAAQSRAIAAQADAEAALERVREMRAVREWLRAHSQPVDTAGQAAGPEQPKESAATRFGRPVPEVALTDLCLQALETLSGTATNKKIRDHLVRDGHDVGLDQVRSSLSYLSRKKPPQVQTDVGSGLWRLLRTAGTPAPFAASSPSINGAGRDA